MKLSTYKSLLTNKRTMLVASQGKCGHAGYVEYQVLFNQGHWQCYKTDGYKLNLVATYAYFSLIFPPSKSLGGTRLGSFLFSFWSQGKTKSNTL
jgi:hypothetical protein